MKRILCFVLVLMLSASALAFDAGRFEGFSCVDVEYDPANPAVYSVKGGFAPSEGWKEFGGHVVARYMNAGKAEELPLMLIAFTTNEGKASNMTIRTGKHRYTVACTDLRKAGMTVIDAEGMVLVTPESVAMLEDIVSTNYARVTIWDEDPAAGYSFVVDGASRAMIRLFLEEYYHEVEPMLETSANLNLVYGKLGPKVETEEAASIAFDALNVLYTEYEPLAQNRSWGDPVVQLQKALINLGLLSGKADGVYGKNTVRAVKAFQTANGLPATGKADAATQQTLYLSVLEKA